VGRFGTTVISVKLVIGAVTAKLNVRAPSYKKLRTGCLARVTSSDLTELRSDRGEGVGKEHCEQASAT
jgi:hypothetical protein